MKTILWILPFLLLSFTAHGRCPASGNSQCETAVRDSNLFNLKLTKVANLFVKEYGRGPKTVILIHGGPGLGGYMKTLGVLLQKNFKVIEYFQRDTSVSGSTGPFEVEDHIEDLHKIVSYYAEENHQKPQVIGHSWGACLTLAFLAKYKGEVEKAIILDSGPLTEDIKVNLIHYMDNALTKDDKEKLSQLDLEMAKITDQVDKDRLSLERRDYATRFYFANQKVTPLPVSSFNGKNSAISRDSYGSWLKKDLFSTEVRKIKDPVVVFHGKKDPVPLDGTFSFFKANLPQARLIAVPKGGHYLWLDRSSKNKILKSLIDELGP